MRIAYFTNGMASTLYSSLELSRRLKNAGHEVVYLSPSDIGAQVSEYGYRFIRLTADETVEARFPKPVPVWRPVAWFRSVLSRRKLLRERGEHDEVERTIAELEPDVLLVDYEMHSVIMSSNSTGIPTLLPIVWFSIFRHINTPPMHTKLPTNKTPLALVRIWLAWSIEWLRRHLGAWKARLRRILTGTVYRPVRYETLDYFELLAFARRKGYRTRGRTSSFHWLKPFVYTDLPVLVFNAIEMELPHQSRSVLHYTGPMVLHNRIESQVDAETRRRVTRFLNDRQSERPLVYCSLGTFWSADTELLNKVLEVFRKRADWDLIMGLGGKLDPSELGTTSENVLVVGYAPQIEVLQQTDCAITHGGITTINECIEFGVPLVVYSTGHIDQNGCAVRIDFHDLGVVANRKKDGPADIEANIERAVTDPVIKQNVTSMRQCFASYKAPDLAVQAVENAGRRCGG